MLPKSLLLRFYPQVRTPSRIFSSLPLFFLLFILRLRFDLVSSQTYRLAFDSVNSPPAIIPTDPKHLIYSVPLNQLISHPIIAYIEDQTGNIVTTLNNSIRAYVTSMDKFQNNPADSDIWRDSGGKLCQWSNPDQDWPIRLNRNFYHTVCGSSLRKTTLIAKVFKGKIIMDWLMHVHPNGELPANNRFIRIEIPALKIIKDTNFFTITEPAASLNITKQPPVFVPANNNFTIEVEILDKRGALLTSGLDSVAYVDLTVAYDQKLFYYTSGKDMLLKVAKARLSGSSVHIFLATRDRVIRKRAIAGKVVYNNIRILDPSFRIRLNLTMIMTRDPFLRIPNCEKCYSDLSYKTITEDNLVQFQIPPPSVLKDIPSMKFTRPINVVSQKLSKLKFITKFKGTGKMKVTRNFPIPGPLRIEIEDNLGNRIHSGLTRNCPWK